MSTNFDSAFEALYAKPHKTKAGLVRVLLPSIEKALAQGRTVKEIWEHLAKAGLPISYPAFDVYVCRARKARTKQMAVKGEESACPASGLASTSSATKQIVPDVSVLPPPRGQRPKIERPGFHYRGTESLDELVYGIKPRKEGL